MSDGGSADSGIGQFIGKSAYRLNGRADSRRHPDRKDSPVWEPPVDYHGPDQGQTDAVVDSKKRRKSLKRLFVRFADRTSMQGVPYINTARLWYAKVLWTLLLIVAVGWMCFHLFYLMSQFLQWPKQTKIKLTFSNLEMPAVTLCNVNIIRLSQAKTAKKPLQDLINLVDPSKFQDNGAGPPGSGGGGAPPGSGSSGVQTGTGGVQPGSGSSGVQTGTASGGVQSGSGSSGVQTGTTSGGGQPGSGGSGAQTGTGSGGLPPGGSGRRKKRFVDDFDPDKMDDYVDYNENDFRDKNGPPRPPRDNVHNLEETFQELYLRERRHIREAMGHQIKDMVISCSFDGYQCYAENFTLFQTADYGNCFSIQSPTYTSKNPGPKHGLSIILFMENSEYIGGMTQGYGARVTINDQLTFPFPADEGFFVSSAFETHIGLKQMNIERLGHPYGQCEEGLAFKQRYGIKYTRATCQNLCMQTTIIEGCGCFENRDVDLLHKTALSRNITSCTTHDELKCLYGILTEYDDKSKACSCKNPCGEKQWIRSTSTRQWPTEPYSMTLLRGLCEKRPQACQQLKSNSKGNRDMSLNFLKLVVYYQDLNHEEISEDAEIETAQFASDVGGAIGLWIGLSILSMFEVFQLVAELCHFAVYKCRTTGDIDKETEDTPPESLQEATYQKPDSLNFNKPHFARDYLYNGEFTKTRQQQ